MSLEVIKTISPSTNQPVLTRHGLSNSELEQLPHTAAAASSTFKQTSLAHRQDIVKKALRLISGKQDELARELTEQMGRPIAFATKEIATAVARGDYLLKISGDALKDTDGEAERGFKRYIRKEPIGPVLVIFAWNVRFFCDSLSYLHSSRGPRSIHTSSSSTPSSQPCSPATPSS